METREANCQQDAIVKRLKKIEGQVKGIQRMIEEGQGCANVLTQVSAVRAAINGVGAMVFKNYALGTLQNALQSPQEQEIIIEELMDNITRFSKTNI